MHSLIVCNARVCGKRALLCAMRGGCLRKRVPESEILKP